MAVLASGGRDERGAGRPGDLGDRGNPGGFQLAAPREGEDDANRADQCHAGGDAHARRHRVDEGAVPGGDQLAALQSADVLADDVGSGDGGVRVMDACAIAEKPKPGRAERRSPSRGQDPGYPRRWQDG
jgi:hypothetical protein